MPSCFLLSTGPRRYLGSQISFSGVLGAKTGCLFFFNRGKSGSHAAGDVSVLTKSGEVGTKHCASVLPANVPGELRAELLIRDFGSDSDDPPVAVEVIGHLHFIQAALDLRGAIVAVTSKAIIG